MATQLFLKRMKLPCGGSGFALVDQDGDVLPHQMGTTIATEPFEHAQLTVKFACGAVNGVPIIDDLAVKEVD